MVLIKTNFEIIKISSHSVNGTVFGQRCKPLNSLILLLLLTGPPFLCFQLSSTSSFEFTCNLSGTPTTNWYPLSLKWLHVWQNIAGISRPDWLGWHSGDYFCRIGFLDYSCNHFSIALGITSTPWRFCFSSLLTLENQL